MLDLSYHRLGVKLYCVNVRCGVLFRDLAKCWSDPCALASWCRTLLIVLLLTRALVTARDSRWAHRLDYRWLPWCAFAAVVSTGACIQRNSAELAVALLVRSLHGGWAAPAVLPTVAVQGPHCATPQYAPICEHSWPTMPARMHRGENCFKATLTGLPLYAHVPCPKGGAVTASESGSWLLNEAYMYRFDRELARYYSQLFNGSSVLELGAGKGCYTRSLLTSSRALQHMRSREITLQHMGPSCLTAYDGAANIEELTRGLVHHADLTSTVSQLPESAYDWVLSSEVGEHIPAQYEERFLQAIASHARRGVVLSWALPGQPGVGHVNPLTNAQVAARMAWLGLCVDRSESARLRQQVNHSNTFAHTMLVYKRRGSYSACDGHVEALATTVGAFLVVCLAIRLPGLLRRREERAMDAQVWPSARHQL